MPPSTIVLEVEVEVDQEEEDIDELQDLYGIIIQVDIIIHGEVVGLIEWLELLVLDLVIANKQLIRNYHNIRVSTTYRALPG